MIAVTVVQRYPLTNNAELKIQRAPLSTQLFLLIYSLAHLLVHLFILLTNLRVEAKTHMAHLYTENFKCCDSTQEECSEKASASISSEDSKMLSSPQAISPEIHLQQRECMARCCIT